MGETDGTIRLYELEAATEDEEIDLRLPTQEDTASGGRQEGGYVVADVEQMGRVAGTKSNSHGLFRKLSYICHKTLLNLSTKSPTILTSLILIYCCRQRVPR